METSNLYQKLKKIAEIGSKYKSVKERESKIIDMLEKENIKFEQSEKCNAKSCTIRTLKNEFRLFYECGYGKYNYGRCFVINK